MINKLLYACLFLTYGTITRAYDAIAYPITWENGQWIILLQKKGENNYKPIRISSATEKEANTDLANFIKSSGFTLADDNPITAENIASISKKHDDASIYFIPVKYVKLNNNYSWIYFLNFLNINLTTGDHFTDFFDNDIQDYFAQAFPSSQRAATRIEPEQSQISSRPPQSNIGSKLNQVRSTINQLKTQISIKN